MSRKAKYTVEEKIQAAERYINGEASAADIAAEMGMQKSGRKSVTEWSATYKENGIEGFNLRTGNPCYTVDQKLQAVEAYLQGEGSLREICNKYNILSKRSLIWWIKEYNSNKER